VSIACAAAYRLAKLLCSSGSLTDAKIGVTFFRIKISQSAEARDAHST